MQENIEPTNLDSENSTIFPEAEETPASSQPSSEPSMSINPNVGGQVSPNASLSQLFTPPPPADPLWPNKPNGVASLSRGENGQIYPELPVYKPEERSLLADYRGDKLSAENNLEVIKGKYEKASGAAKVNLEQEVTIAEQQAQKANKNFLGEVAKTARGKEFNALHQEALDEDKKRDEAANLAAQAEAQRLADEAEDLRKQAELLTRQQEQSVAEVARRRFLSKVAGAALIVATTVLAGPTIISKTRDALRELNRLVPISTDRNEGIPSINSALNIPNDFEVDELPVSPTWYMRPAPNPKGGDNLIIYTRDSELPVIETQDPIEYLGDIYYLFNRGTETFALRITQSKTEGGNPEVEFVKITQKLPR